MHERSAAVDPRERSGRAPSQTIIIATLASSIVVVALALNALVLKQMQAQIPLAIQQRASKKRRPKGE